jgi:hypothetical protein
MLRQIAKNGHVYHQSATIQDLEKTQGQLQIKLIGVNDASVLPIFCEPHDSGAFAPLEQARFTSSKEQCFLLAYRAICHELAKKLATLSSIPVLKGFYRGKSFPEQVKIQTMFAALAAANETSVRDMEVHKQEFDAMLLANNYTDLQGYVVTFESAPEILCAGGLYPECDFAGKPLQNLGDFSKTMEQISFALIATEQGGPLSLPGTRAVTKCVKNWQHHWIRCPMPTCQTPLFDLSLNSARTVISIRPGGMRRTKKSKMP